ncbi:MAG: hypothetical protein Q7R95_11660 [bacterium]|nr:hypothetical protein [bacterium]
MKEKFKKIYSLVVKSNITLGIIIFIACLLLGGVVSIFYVLSTSMVQILIFLILFSYVLTLILLYIFSTSFKDYINQRAASITVVFLMAPIIIFSFQLILQTFSSTLEAEMGIKQSTHYNYELLKIVRVEIESDPNVIIWSDFDSGIYQKYLDYILKNYSEECAGKYLTTIYEINQFNNIGKLNRELLIAKIQSLASTIQVREYLELVNDLVQDQVRLISDIESDLSFVMNHCQDLKQR